MSTYKTKCDICGAVNEVPNYGEWDCCQCGQGYTYDEGHQIRLTDAQWALLRNQPRWVPVEERLPECDVPVLAWDMTEQSWRIAYRDGTWYMVGFDDDTAICVTHWMPLPEPPR